MDDELKVFYHAYLDSAEIALPGGLGQLYQMSVGEVLADILRFLLLRDENRDRVHDVLTILDQMEDYGLEDFALKVRYATEGNR